LNTFSVLTGQLGRHERRPMSGCLLTDILQKSTEASRAEDEDEHHDPEQHERYE
jgi:hypothetical protein